MRDIRHRSILAALALTAVVVATAACTPSGGLGQVPTVPPTPTASLASGRPTRRRRRHRSSRRRAVRSGSPSVAPSSPGRCTVRIARPARPWSSAPITSSAARPASRASSRRSGSCPKTAGVARAAMDALLDPDPISDKYHQISTAIPPGTELLGISIKNGVATVDLSREFAIGRRQRIGALPPRPGRLHADPVLDGPRRSCSRSRARRSRRSGREGIVLDGPQARKDFERPAARRSSSTDRRSGPRPATRPASPATPTSSRRRSGSRSSTASGKVLVDQHGDGDLRDRLPRARSTSRCGTTSRRRSGGRCGSTTARPRTARRRTSVTTRSG